MGDYMKLMNYLPVLARHPALVSLFQEISKMVEPHMTEINQALGEVESITQQLYPQHKV